MVEYEAHKYQSYLPIIQPPITAYYSQREEDKDDQGRDIGFTPTSNMQVAVMMDVTLDANTMPQFWFFIYNSSTLQSSLPSLGGASLNTTVGNYT